MLNWLKRIFGKRRGMLPCDAGDCPYEYDKDSDRDIEGMPFVDDDPRSCPVYGHVCPEFMEDFGLTVDDLSIRAAVHCATVMQNLVQAGEEDPNGEPYKKLMERVHEIERDYPPEKYPQYYS